MADNDQEQMRELQAAIMGPEGLQVKVAKLETLVETKMEASDEKIESLDRKLDSHIQASASQHAGLSGKVDSLVEKFGTLATRDDLRGIKDATEKEIEKSVKGVTGLPPIVEKTLGGMLAAAMLALAAHFGLSAKEDPVPPVKAPSHQLPVTTTASVKDDEGPGEDTIRADDEAVAP